MLRNKDAMCNRGRPAIAHANLFHPLPPTHTTVVWLLRLTTFLSMGEVTALNRLWKN